MRAGEVLEGDMAISDIPILSMLRTRMQWQQERQRVLAENVANADTPNYQAKDIAEPSFNLSSPGLPASLALSRTAGAHLAGLDGGSSFAQKTSGNGQVRPAGNAVSLEDEMMKAGDNQADYQLAASLYQKSLDALKIAVGKR